MPSRGGVPNPRGRSEEGLLAASVLRDDFALVVAQVDDEALLQLPDAHADDLLRLLEGHVGLVVAVHKTEGEHRAVPVRSLVHLLHGGQVVQEVQGGSVLVAACDQEVGLERPLPERGGELVPGEVGRCLGGQLEAGLQGVELDVLLNEFNEVRRVGCRPRCGDQHVLNLPDLVGVILHPDDRESGLAIGREDHEVLPAQPERRLSPHGAVVWCT
mmetsp:Transcript_67307/g.197605  ORF Transcript_67307/g.197605 Transcript_67307/m.197605 type:complete len:215 (-) Transcript_67307:58-702(-)